jgi:hypothetical protein
LCSKVDLKGIWQKLAFSIIEEKNIDFIFDLDKKSNEQISKEIKDPFWQKLIKDSGRTPNQSKTISSLEKPDN